MNKSIIVSLCAALASLSTFAAEGEITNVTVRSLGSIASPVGAHRAGNMEITLDAPAPLPTGVICDPTYFTTARVNDPDRVLFTLLKDAKVSRLRVNLRISDAPGLQAFPGRCSVMAVGLAAQ